MAGGKSARPFPHLCLRHAFSDDRASRFDGGRFFPRAGLYGGSPVRGFRRASDFAGDWASRENTWLRGRGRDRLIRSRINKNCSCFFAMRYGNYLPPSISSPCPAAEETGQHRCRIRGYWQFKRCSTCPSTELLPQFGAVAVPMICSCYC